MLYLSKESSTESEKMELKRNYIIFDFNKMPGHTENIICRHKHMITVTDLKYIIIVVILKEQRHLLCKANSLNTFDARMKIDCFTN